MEEKVLDVMKKAGQPMRPGDIAKALGVDAKEVSKAIDALKKADKINSPKRCSRRSSRSVLRRTIS